MTPEERPDRHLQAALRHAPDADLQAPEALRESIVAAARAALAADRAALPPKKRWWQGLWPASPLGLGASGAFATLALGGVIALLWRGEPPPPAVVASAEVQQSVLAPAAPAASLPDTAAAAPTLKMESRRESVAKAAPVPLREAAPPRVAVEARKAAANDMAVAAPPAPAAEPAPAAAEAPVPQASMAPAAPAAPPVQPARLEASRLADGPARERAAGALQVAPAGRASALVRDDDTRWLAEVRRVVQDRWRASSDTSIPGAREKRIGALRVAVGGGRVLWCTDGTPPACSEAALQAEEEARLLAAMPR